MNMGHFSNGVVGVSVLSLLACGGISSGSGTDETGGSSNGGATSHAAGGSSTSQGRSTSRGGSTNNAAGAASTGGSGPIIGGATMTLQPPVDSGVACFNDTDCPYDACGGEVCNWSRQAPVPDGMKIFYCNAAGTDAKSMDGWCTSDADCKCLAQGAKCIGVHCSFTRAADAPRQ